ncbi:hypothetical protein MRX96_041748 [Rhipicephalus microplus]
MNTPPAANVNATQDVKQTRLLEPNAITPVNHGSSPTTAARHEAQLGETQEIRHHAEPGTSNLPSNSDTATAPVVNKMHPKPDALLEEGKHPPSTAKVDEAPRDNGTHTTTPNLWSAVQRSSTEESITEPNLKETPLANPDSVPLTSQHFPHSSADAVAPAAEEAYGRPPMRPDMLPVKPQHPTSFATANRTPQPSGASPTGNMPPPAIPEPELSAAPEHALSHEDARLPGFLSSSTSVLPEKISATSLLEPMSGCLNVPPGTIDSLEGAAQVTKQKTLRQMIPKCQHKLSLPSFWDRSFQLKDKANNPQLIRLTRQKSNELRQARLSLQWSRKCNH